MFIRISVLALSFACLTQAQQPNVVIFFSDDHTNQAISAYQDLPNAAVQDALFKDWAPAQTPNIDRLADQGVVWRHSYVNNSICSPSRANLLTGLHSHANGLYSNQQTFDGSQQTLPKLLQAADYNTGIFGKWHLKSTPTGFDHYEILSGDNGQGFYYSPVIASPSGSTTYSGQYVADVTTDRALAWLQDRIDNSVGDPFLLFVNHKGPHRAWQPGPQETDPAVFRAVEWDYTVIPNPDTAPGDPASWTPATVPVPTNFDDRLTNYATRANGARTQNMEVATNLRLDQDLKLEGTFGGTAYDEVRTWWNANKGGMSDSEKHAYYQQRYLKDYMLTGKAVDRGVGEVLDFLEANDLDHNTIIIYSSDQGFYLGEHGWYDKRWMYQESFRTPLIIQWKDGNGNSLVNAGSVADEMVQVMDIGPTVLEAAGVTPETPMHGSSFLGYLTAMSGDEPATWRDALYYHYQEGASAVHNVQKHYGVFDGRYKLINHYELNSSQQWELFDLESDPLEMNNLLYNADTGIIDDPEDGIDGDAAFQTLVRDLMVQLSDLRTQFHDTTGSSFTIPDVGDPGDPPPSPDVDLNSMINLPVTDAVYSGQATATEGVDTAAPAPDSGFTMSISVSPTSGDLGGTVLLMELGETRNGSGIYLVDGVPTVVMKQGSTDSATPNTLNDLTLPEVAVQSSFGAVETENIHRITAVYAPPVPSGGTTGRITLLVAPEGGNITRDIFKLGSDSTIGNWFGDAGLTIGTLPGTSAARGGLSTTPGTFDTSSLQAFGGDISMARYWNATGEVLNLMRATLAGHDGTAMYLTLEGAIRNRPYHLLRDTDLPISASSEVLETFFAGVGPDHVQDNSSPDPKAFYYFAEIFNEVGQIDNEGTSGPSNYGQSFLLDSSLFPGAGYTLVSLRLHKGELGGGGSGMFMDVYREDTSGSPDFSAGTGLGGLSYLGSSSNVVDYFAANDAMTWEFDGIELVADKRYFLVLSSDDQEGNFQSASFRIDATANFLNLVDANSNPLFRGITTHAKANEDNRYSIRFLEVP